MLIYERKHLVDVCAVGSIADKSYAKVVNCAIGLQCNTDFFYFSKKTALHWNYLRFEECATEH